MVNGQTCKHCRRMLKPWAGGYQADARGRYRVHQHLDGNYKCDTYAITSPYGEP